MDHQVIQEVMAKTEMMEDQEVKDNQEKMQDKILIPHHTLNNVPVQIVLDPLDLQDKKEPLEQLVPLEPQEVMEEVGHKDPPVLQDKQVLLVNQVQRDQQVMTAELYLVLHQQAKQVQLEKMAHQVVQETLAVKETQVPMDAQEMPEMLDQQENPDQMDPLVTEEQMDLMDPKAVVTNVHPPDWLQDIKLF